MAKTIANTRTLTRLYLDENSEADWLDAEVDIAINEYYHEVISAVVDVYEDFYLTTDTFDTTTSQQEYTSADGLATDVLKLRRVEINMQPSDSSSVAVRAFPVQLDQVKRRLGDSTLGTNRSPAYYRYGFESSLTLGFLPIPSDGGTAAGKIWYIQKQSDLSDSNTSVNIPYADNYYRLIALGAAGSLLRKGQQEEVVAKQYLQEFEAGLGKMRMQLEEVTADDSKEVVDSVGDDTIYDIPLFL